MKTTFDQNANIVVRQIDSADAEAYRDYYKSLKKPAHFEGLLHEKDLDDPKTYQEMFAAITNTDDSSDYLVMFGLFNQRKMIGQTSITFINTANGKAALFAGSEIADEYRGRGLANKLYECRQEYLQGIGFKGEVVMTINHDNTPSVKAAERNSFIHTGEIDEHGNMRFLLQL